MLETTYSFPIQNLFDDNDYAWRLLQAQISIQMSPTVSGQQIAKLLQLYMKGVQKMNSISDQRQSYFKNKVTSLMTKGVVIKSLKQNPMKKKTKHQQATCKQQTKPVINKKASQNIQSKQQKNVLTRVNHIQLKQKQKQLQMRIQYQRQQNNPDNLRKLMLQQQCRQQNISKKINNIMKDHEQRLKQRIKARKLRTATYRTQSIFNQQSQTQPSTNNMNSNKKQDLYFFQPNDIVKNKQSSIQNKINKQNQTKKWKSLQHRDYIHSQQSPSKPKRKRKYTIDLD